LGVDRPSPGYCRVTFNHPPINTITATTVIELAELVGLIEQDSDLNVVVFDSANPDFYLAHYDVEYDPARTAAIPGGPTGMPAWIDLLVRLSRAPVVSIASIRGRARGAGSEFVLACDIRFASRENTLLGHFEVVTGLVPGGGPMAWRSRPADSEFPPALSDFFELFGRPAQQAHLARLESLGLNTESDLERRLGRRVVDALPDD
jgi:enoyl-CoA hydratase/carnithine racemase